MARIGFDSRLVFRKQRSGLGNYAFHLLSAMVAQPSGHQFQLYHDARADIERSLGGGAVNFQELASFPSRFHAGQQFWLPLQARRDRLSLLHCPANYLPLIQPCPTVVTVHDMILSLSDEGETPTQLFYWRKLIPIGLRKASRIITVSHHSKRDIVNLLEIEENKVVVIHSGVDPFFTQLSEMEVHEQLRRLNVPTDYVFLLGAASPRKNVQRALKAFIYLKKQGFGPKLVMTIGNERFKAQLTSILTEACIVDEVIFLPPVSQENLRILYNGSLVFLYPSLYEGFGFPILEAMACGTPVITSDTSSMSEIAGDAAILVDPTNEQSIAGELAKLCQSAETRSKMINAGLLRSKIFCWEKAALQTLRTYESVI